MDMEEQTYSTVELEDAVRKALQEARGHGDTEMATEDPMDACNDQQRLRKDDDGEQVFCCWRCRAILFTSDNFLEHTKQRHSIAERKLRKDGNGISNQQHRACSSWFLEKTTVWMENLASTLEIEGKLLCYNCSNRVGSFSWSGSQCSCGTWVVPALQFPKSKVDPRFVQKDKVPRICLPSDKQESQEDRMKSVNTMLMQSHEEWSRNVVEGKVDELVSKLCFWKCSIQTVRGEDIAGKDAVSKNLVMVTPKLVGRIEVAETAMILNETGTNPRRTRCMYKVTNPKNSSSAFLQETIEWSGETNPTVEKITRKKLD